MKIGIKIHNKSQKLAALHFLHDTTGHQISPLVLDATLAGEQINEFPIVYDRGDAISATSTKTTHVDTIIDFKELHKYTF